MWGKRQDHIGNNPQVVQEGGCAVRALESAYKVTTSSAFSPTPGFSWKEKVSLEGVS